jgi:glycosyltransferase involved in cell wall biosynthesis
MSSDREKTLDLSVIVPIFNEEGNIEPLYRGLKSTLEGLKKDYEIIFIDDGSSDSPLRYWIKYLRVMLR